MGETGRLRVAIGGARPPGGLLRVRALPHPRPIRFPDAKAFDHRISKDIGRFHLQVVMIANAMIKKVGLPTNAEFPGGISLPIPNYITHGAADRKREQGMSMIGHQEKQPAIPTLVLMVILRRAEQAVGEDWVG